MQQHEGPGHDPRATEKERRRQRSLTGWLCLAIATLVILIGATLILR